MNTKKRVKMRGFSLTELLVVMAIITMLSTASFPLATGLIRGNQVSRSLQTLQGLMDQARQHAIARNTYVWLAWSEEDPGVGTQIALIESKTGGDALGWSQSAVSLSGHADLQLLGKVELLEGICLVEGGVELPGLEDISAVPPSEVDLLLRSGDGAVRFVRALQFAPTGETRVRVAGRVIEFGLQPLQGGESGENVALIRLVGATGKISTYRRE